MSAMRTSLTEPFALTRYARESFADWFEQDARASSPSMTAARISFDGIPEMIVVRGAGELSPSVAGAMAGAVAGPTMVAVATAMSARAHHALDLPAMMAHAVRAPSAWAHPIGWSMAVVMGAVLGGLFAMLTRRLRTFPGMIAFAIISSFAMWTALHGLVLTRAVPWLAKMLPYGPMVLGAMAAGVVLSLQVPIRTRKIA
jgi:hypothetical protein